MSFGLLGEHLSHSYSIGVHQALGNSEYKLYEKAPDEVKAFLSQADLKGLNVTIPYKKLVMDYCHSLSEEAERIGAVNTLVKREGLWHGENTDYYGFLYLLKRKKVVISNFTFLILGDGATSKTVSVALRDKGAKKIIQLSRKKAPFYHEIGRFYKEVDYIINTTSVGTYPKTEDFLISLAGFRRLKGVFDVIYNPFRTRLLMEAEKRGLVYSDGLPMLVAQAYYADELFFNRKNDVILLEQMIHKLYQEKENIILIGMPGVGKTTLGKRLAKVLNRTFYDSDKVLREQIGELSVFIENNGEPIFRQKESEVIRQLGKEKGLIIACGGGIILKEENYYHLRQNGRIYQLDRALAELSTKNRPFSQGGFERLKALYETRIPFYQDFRQVYVRHFSKEETTKKILEEFNENCGN